MSPRTDVDGLATRFAACRIPHEEWTHPQFLETCPPPMSLAERVAQLLDSPVASKDALLRFYSLERLMSAQARAAWVEPDVLPLRVANLPGSKSNVRVREPGRLTHRPDR